jgi:hypothetical protein
VGGGKWQGKIEYRVSSSEGKPLKTFILTPDTLFSTLFLFATQCSTLFFLSPRHLSLITTHSHPAGQRIDFTRSPGLFEPRMLSIPWAADL